MKKLLFIFLIVSLKLSATNYYVKSTGNDSNTGLSDLQAWQTLSKVNTESKAGNFNEGDSILFKRDNEFTAVTIYIPNGVKIGVYGIGAKPLFNGMYTVTGFTQVNDSLYYKTMVLPYIQWISFDGKIKQKDENEGFNLDYVDRDNYKMANSSFSEYDLVGSELYCHLNDWIQYCYPIIAQNGDTITIEVRYEGYYDALKTTTKVWIQNEPEQFNTNGDWAWYEDTLWVHSEDAITNHSVELSICDTMFRITSSEDVSIKGIEIKGINNAIILPSMSGSLDFTHSKTTFASFIVPYDIGGVDGEHLKTAYNKYEDIVGYGFYNYRADTMSHFADTANRLGIKRGLANFNSTWNGFFDLSGANTHIEAIQCVLDSLGYNGMSIGSDSSFAVRYNLIANTNLKMRDGAGIHCAGVNPNLALIDHNILINAERGIYADYGAENFRVNNNLSINCYNGFYTNDGKHMYVNDNTFWKCGQGIKFQQWDDSVNIGYLMDLHVTNNIVYNPIYTNLEYAFGPVNPGSTDWADVDFGMLDSNIYINSLDAKPFRLGGSVTGVSNFTFSEYQAKGYEPNAQYITNVTPQLLYNASMDTVVISFADSTKIDAYDEVYVNSLTLLPFENVVIKSTEYTPPTPTPPTTTIYGFEIYKGNKVEYLFIKKNN